MTDLVGQVARYRQASAQLRRLDLTEQATVDSRGCMRGPMGRSKAPHHRAERDHAARLILTESTGLVLALVTEDLLLRELAQAVANNLPSGGVQERLKHCRKLIARLTGQDRKRNGNAGRARPHWPQPEEN